jgi:hypothetical protein
MSGTEFTRPPRILTGQEKSDGRFGSPLKNVALTTSSLNSPLEAPAPVSSGSEKIAEEIASLDQTMQQEGADSVPSELPPPPPEPMIKEENAAVETLREEKEEEAMLLDIVDAKDQAEVNAPDSKASEALAPVAPEVPTLEPAEAVESEAAPESSAVTELPAPTSPSKQAESKPEEVVTGEPDAGPVPEKVKEDMVEQTQEDNDDDDFPDLLGGLEKSLNKPSV